MGLPLHIVRVSQLSIDHSVSGRGVLQLTAVEQRIFMLAGLAMLMQMAMMIEGLNLGVYACKVVNFFLGMISMLGLTSGTSIAVCR